MSAVKEIQKNLKTSKLVIGTKRTLKLLSSGKLSKVFVALNAAKSTEEDLNYYSKLVGIELQSTGLSNSELGALCKKPFNISVIGLLK